MFRLPEKYYKAYLLAYEKLNTEQKKAVDQINGPVMVTGRPGTGKTHVLALRICRILFETNARPGNILCFTYTDSDAVAMRKQLISYIGTHAYNISICTFEAFCQNVIQQNPLSFGKTSLDHVSELEKTQLLKSLIDDFPKNHPLKSYRVTRYSEIANLLRLFSIMKKEGWTPGFINSKIDGWINGITARNEQAMNFVGEAGVKAGSITEETAMADKLRAAANEFYNFQALMFRKKRYDPDDAIYLVLNVFQQNNNLLSCYKQKFDYILVDDYQDINGTQNQLLHILQNFSNGPNIFVAGDDDQRIANNHEANSTMLEFAKTYAKELVTVVLSGNYRHTETLQNISKTIISRNTAYPATALHWPEIHEYETRQQEIDEIIEKLDVLIAKGTEPARIAVIFNDDQYGEEILKYATLRNIPMHCKRGLNLLHVPLVAKLLNILRYLAAEHDRPYSGENLLFEILHYDFFNIPAFEVAKIAVEVNNKKHKGELTCIRKLLQEKVNTPQQTLFNINIHKELGDAASRLEKLIADVPNVPIQTLFQQVIHEAGVLHYISRSSQQNWLMHILNATMYFIQQETARNPAMSLVQLMQTIDLMMENKIPLSEVRATENEKGVHLLTVHDSKGMEYDHVFLVGCNAANWEDTTEPPGIVRYLHAIILSQSGSRLEKLRRLFYVALTRVRENLYISYTRFNTAGQETKPSMFVAEILNQYKLALERHPILKPKPISFTAQTPRIAKAEEDFISKLLTKFVMSVTALNNYLKCPLEFYFKNLIRAPSGKSEAMEFGCAVHFALQRFFEKMKTDPSQRFPSEFEMLEDFRSYIFRQRQSFTEEAFNRRLEYGEEILPDYHNKYINTWNRIVAVERNIQQVMVKGVPLKGKLDKLEFNGKEVNIVDYKTGDYEKARKKLQPPSEAQPHGGDYWRQAVFYKLLIDNYPAKNWKVASIEFDFIEPGKNKDYHKPAIIILPQDMETVTHQITEVWHKIQHREFYNGCGKDNCQWCNLLVPGFS